MEGPFAGNRLYVEMLVAATGRPVEAMTSSTTGTSIGAALLARMQAGQKSGTTRAPITGSSTMMTEYAEEWRATVNA